MIKKKDKKRYYIIGIGGVAMGNLAGLLKQKGHEVVGSDQAEMYEPMKGMLKSLKIKVFSPYDKLHVKRWKPDVVVVGNAINRGNPELEYVMSNGHSYRSVSDILREEFIEGKKAIVVTGTHGKTTVTALIAWILEYAGFDPTIFVGGFMRNIGSGFKYGKGEFVVLEGDEYSTSFFDKNPKYLGYRPYIGLINNIELDHVDLYPNIDRLKEAYSNFIRIIPENGLISACADDSSLTSLIVREIGTNINLGNLKSPKICTFGLSSGDFVVKPKTIKSVNGKMSFQVKHKGNTYADISVNLIGKHNIGNILGAISAANFMGISAKVIRGALSSYLGVKRRLELIHEGRGILVFDDYAHHPTAVHKTIQAVREAFPMKRVIAIFEPGSASSKKRIFEEQYYRAFLNASSVLLFKPYHSEGMSSKERFSGNTVSRRLNGAGVSSHFFDDVDKLLFHVKSNVHPGDILLVMSCRGFDGLRERLVKEL